MKLTLDSVALDRVMARTKRALGKGQTIPILTSALLEAEGDRLTIVTTDMQAWLRQELGVEVEEGGCLTADAQKMASIAHRLPKGSQIALKSNGSADLRLTSGRSRFRLLTLDPEDFPRVPPEKASCAFSIPSKTLIEAFEFVEPSMSREEARKYLNGAFVTVTADQVVIVATDGITLRRISVPKPDGAEDWPGGGGSGADNGVILPNAAVIDTAALFKDAGDLEVVATESRVQFAAPSLTYTTRLVDGIYPDYERVIPKGAARLQVEVESQALRDAVERTAPIASSGQGGGIACFRIGDGKILIAARSEDGEALDEVEAKIEGDGQDAAFRSGYLTAALDSLKAQTVQISFFDNHNGVRIEDPGAADRVIVVMLYRATFPETKL